MILEHHVAHVERDPLRDTKAGAVCDLKHGTVAECERLIEGRRCEQLLDFLHTQDFRKGAPPLWRLEPLTRISDDEPFSKKKLEVATHGGNVSSDRSRRESQ